jgi:prevent-host-death family protein
MQTIGVRELKERASEILRRVREERATFDVTYRGRVMARLSPVEPTQADIEESLRLLDELEHIGAEISKRLEGPVDAVEIVRKVRRDL